jgi:hypothetical protein
MMSDQWKKLFLVYGDFDYGKILKMHTYKLPGSYGEKKSLGA